MGFQSPAHHVLLRDATGQMLSVKFDSKQMIIIGFSKNYNKGAGYSDSLRKTIEELLGRDTSRHPKVFKIVPNHGCH